MALKIRSRAPLRLGFAGGGTDIEAYCNSNNGLVLNSTISIYAYTNIKVFNEKKVRIISSDLNQKIEKLSDGEFELDDLLTIHKAVYNYMILNYNDNKILPIEISTYCSIPPGSGLGSSSTIVVSLIRAFVEYLNLPLDDLSIAKLAIKIEREDCKFSGGRQDQYAASCGGFNFMEFNKNNHTIVNSLRIKNWIKCELEASLILYFTGISRKSSEIIEDQTTNIQLGKNKSLEAMHKMRSQAKRMKEALICGDLETFCNSLNEGWEAKKSSSKSVSNEYIEEIYKSAIESGATAGKLSGAGGGGFMLFYSPPEKKGDVIRNLQVFGGKIYDFHFTEQGCQAWTV